MQLSCPQCGKMLEAPYPLPSVAQCPFCSAVFTPEAPAGAPPPPGQPIHVVPGSSAAEIVKGPAIALAVAGISSLIWAVLNLSGGIYLLRSLQQGQPLPPLPPPFQNLNIDAQAITMGMGFDVVRILVGALVIYGALRMRRLESYGLAITCSLLSLVPCVTCCFCLGVPFGIWSLVVLNQREVRASFR